MSDFLLQFQVYSAMLMEHLLCDDVGGKHNVCGMVYKVTYCHICTINWKYLSVI